MTFCTELEELKRSDRPVLLEAIASKKVGHSKKGLGAEISFAQKSPFKKCGTADWEP